MGYRKSLFSSTLGALYIGSPGSSAADRVARPMAEPAGMGRVGGRAGAGLPGATGPARRGRPQGAQETDVDENVSNARPQRLADAHAALNSAVASAYGWPADITDNDALRELLALNGR